MVETFVSNFSQHYTLSCLFLVDCQTKFHWLNLAEQSQIFLLGRLGLAGKMLKLTGQAGRLTRFSEFLHQNVDNPLDMRHVLCVSALWQSVPCLGPHRSWSASSTARRCWWTLEPPCCKLLPWLGSRFPGSATTTGFPLLETAGELG